MSLKLECRFNQKLTISHRMQQSLSLLSLSQEELNQAIQRELLENPLLETVDSKASLSEEQRSEVSGFRIYDCLESPYMKKGESSKGFVEDFLTEPASLKNHILKQVEMSFFPKDIKALLPLLVSYLNERAYLTVDIEELAEKEKISFRLLESALFALQSLEPVGIGGRNLKECLLIQLRQKKGDTTKAALIVKGHLTNLKEKKYMAIAHDLGISFEETLKLCRLIQSLEPDPGRNFSSQPTVLVYPDLHIYKQGQDYHIILNKDFIPELKFSHEYVRTIRATGNLKPQEKKYLSEKTTSAHWFIRALQQRQDKIKKIAMYFVKHQKDFFEKGSSYLKPLRMQDLAEELDLHVSTISRAVNNKYAYTPQGLVALKCFFQKGLMTEKGDFISVKKIKESIKKWIEEEKPEQPLSDEQIRIKAQKNLHVCLLRRSISQYRLSMEIPSLRIRKLNFLSSQGLKNYGKVGLVREPREEFQAAKF